jgi:hypothetical protein
MRIVLFAGANRFLWPVENGWANLDALNAK